MNRAQAWGTGAILRNDFFVFGSFTTVQDLLPHELLGPLNAVERKHVPATLYIAGNPAFLRTGGRVSIVGARKSSNEGLARARRFAGLLAERRVVVVSGLAEGVDAAAHRSAIDRGGSTIAVIGTPLDRSYPKQNAELQAEIAARHLLISQFPSGYSIKPANFPMRNRTMALVSDASVIIEASETSGSLSEGWEVLRLGRPLFITKAMASDKKLKWPQKMLGYGAQILSAETIEDFFGSLPSRT